MNPPPPDTTTALQPFEPAPGAVYSIEVVAHLTRIPRHRIAVYCRHGLVSPLATPENAGWIFDDDAIRTLRLVEGLRASSGANLSGLRLISELLRDIEELRREVRFLRGH